MPPNRFESEVESFLEGSHGDRTHIKRADHPRLHHYAGRYSGCAHTLRIPPRGMRRQGQDTHARPIGARRGACGARPRCRRAAAGPGYARTPDWSPPRGLRGQAAVPVGGGRAWPGFETTRQATPQRPGAAGVEGAGGTGGHGRASRSTTPSRRLACGDLAGGRARRRPEHQRCHNETRPRPVSRPRPRHAHAAPFTTAPPAIRRSCPRDPQPRRGQPRGGRRGRGTGSRTRSRHPRCGRSGSTAGRHRAHHTRRA